MPANRKARARLEALREEMRRQHPHRLGVGVGPEHVAQRGELAAQGLEILDDAIVHDSDPVGGDRMGIGLGRQAMRRPAGVPDADHPLYRLVIEPPGEVDELAFRSPAFDASVDQRPDSGRIVPAIFEAP